MGTIIGLLFSASIFVDLCFLIFAIIGTILACVACANGVED